MSGMSEASGSVRAPPDSRVITLLQSAWGNCVFPTPPLLPAALARTSLVLWQLEPPPESAWGSPAGQRPAPRGNCSTQFPVCVEPIEVTVERSVFSTSRGRAFPPFISPEKVSGNRKGRKVSCLITQIIYNHICYFPDLLIRKNSPRRNMMPFL